MSRIRYLSRDEKDRTRALYETCFPEDSREFVDYYYDWKCRDNDLAVLEEGETLQCMVHGNPYTVSFCGHLLPVHYIVAVATDPSCRRQGLMRQLLSEVLEDYAAKGEAFTFLMPADPAYYVSMGYRFWNSQKIRIPACDIPEEIFTELTEEVPEDLPIQINDTLKDHFSLYIYRDMDYYRRLLKEQQSEAGGIRILRNESGECKGIYCYDREEGFQIREPILPSDYIREESKALMMGRILHLGNFIRSLRTDEPFEKILEVTDPLISENNGCFRIRIDGTGGTLEPADLKDSGEKADIAELGEILFSQMSVFINEVV